MLRPIPILSGYGIRSFKEAGKVYAALVMVAEEGDDNTGLFVHEGAERNRSLRSKFDTLSDWTKSLSKPSSRQIG